jgi:hypothetical protein
MRNVVIKLNWLLQAVLTVFLISSVTGDVVHFEHKLDADLSQASVISDADLPISDQNDIENFDLNYHIKPQEMLVDYQNERTTELNIIPNPEFATHYIENETGYSCDQNSCGVSPDSDIPDTPPYSARQTSDGFIDGRAEPISGSTDRADEKAAVREYEAAVQELQAANSELQSALTALRSAESSLFNASQKYNQAVSDRNNAASQTREAAQRAHRSQTELNRLQEVLTENKTTLKTEEQRLTDLEQKLKVTQSDVEEHFLKAHDGAAGTQEKTDTTQDLLRKSQEQHNAKASLLSQKARLQEGLDSINHSGSPLPTVIPSAFVPSEFIADHGDQIQDRYTLTSPLGEFRDSLETTYLTLTRVKPTSDLQSRAKEFGVQAVKIADQSYAGGDIDTAHMSQDLALGLADGVLGFVPGVGWARDVYESITGYNLITEERLSTTDRLLAVIGSITVGLGSETKSISKIAEKVGVNLDELRKSLDFADAIRGERLVWDAWGAYPKVIVSGREYAQIGKRLYTEHALERMMPRGLTTNGRSISPNFIEDVITSSKPMGLIVDGVPRQLYRSGSVEVVTEQGGKLIVSVNPFKNR